jgi:superfamily II DNA/RNA helicase
MKVFFCWRSHSCSVLFILSRENEREAVRKNKKKEKKKKQKKKKKKSSKRTVLLSISNPTTGKERANRQTEQPKIKQAQRKKEEKKKKKKKKKKKNFRIQQNKINKNAHLSTPQNNVIILVFVQNISWFCSEEMNDQNRKNRSLIIDLVKEGSFHHCLFAVCLCA